MNARMFNYGTQAQYDAAVRGNIIEPSCLYFIGDTQRIYRGYELIAMTSVFYMEEVPSVDRAREHTMYVVKDCVYIKIDNQMVSLNQKLVEGAIQSLTMFDSNLLISSSQSEFTPSDETLMTSKKIVELVKSETDNTIVGAKWSPESGAISFDLHKEDECFDLGLDGLVHDVSYNAEKYQLVIPVYGRDDVIVNIPKCIKSGRFENEYLLPDGTTGKAIVLVIDAPGSESGESEIVIPADGLIHSYLPHESASVKVTISEKNEIVADLKVAPDEHRVTIGNDGLMLDLNEYSLRANPADVDKVAIIDKDGNYLGSKKIVEIYQTESNISDMLPTFGVVSAAISEAIKSIITFKILPEGEPGMILVSTEDGVTRSDYRIGGETLNLDTEDNLLATEAAVIDALSWRRI